MRLAPPGKLRIAQVAPLSERVPPKLYGGTERVVSVLADELVRQGHAVTLFASGDSRTAAKLVAPCPQAQRLMGCVDPLAAHVLMIEQVAQRADEFDVIHFHVAPVHFPIVRRLGTPHLTTMHGRLDLPDLRPLYEEFSELPLVSISDAQRAPLPNQIDATRRTHTLDRRACRDAFSRRFSAPRMASAYVRLYRQLASCAAGANFVA